MSRDVVVVGGGFAGLIAAAALAQRGAQVRVLEAAVGPAGAFRGELIHPSGVRGLLALGLKAPLLACGGVEVDGFAVSPGSGHQPIVLPYAHRQGLGLGIDHKRMVKALRTEVGQHPEIELVEGVRVENVLRAGRRVVGVTTADGVEHRADLVVVADGRQSKLRGLLGFAAETRLLSYSITFAVRGELPHARSGHVFLGAPGPILAYPFGDGMIRFCVDVPLGAAKGRDAIVALLIEKYAPVVPAQLRESMIRSLAEAPFEGCANHAITTQQCAAPGVVLIGDAGGCAHPLTASGMSNAMNDVTLLAELVGTSGATEEVLAEYQRYRYDFVRMRELFTDSLYEVFRAHDEGSRALQTGVFAYWRRSAGARRASMDILSGEEVRSSRFMVEYSRVFGVSALAVVKEFPRRPRAGVSRLKALGRTSVSRLSEAVTRSARSFIDRYRLELRELG
ncbi:MAG: NAD(P)/FAD-dependent oxidoreductase [Myxococcales bacterium]|nr:NAD(P)/FAD-dependent oxidoreductase [Myxococcales bacterium]